RRANLRNNRNQGRSAIKGRPGIPFPAGLSLLANSAKLSAFLRLRVLVELLDNLFRQVAYTQGVVALADLPYRLVAQIIEVGFVLSVSVGRDGEGRDSLYIFAARADVVKHHLAGLVFHNHQKDEIGGLQGIRYYE